MKLNTFFYSTILIFTTIFVAACSDNESSKLSLDESNSVVVTVNGRQLTRDQMHRELMNLVLTLGTNMSPRLLEAKKMEFELQAIQNLINTELLVTEARNRGIRIQEEEIQEQIKVLQSSYDSGERFQKELHWREITPDELFAEARQSLLVEKLMDQVLHSVPEPSLEEIQEFFSKNSQLFFVPEQVRAAHILIQVSPDDSEVIRKAKREELARIREEIINGAVFEEIAQEHSDCPSKTRGGDLGWFPRERMAQDFSEVAFSLETGTISEIVRTDFGFHIIKVYERREQRVPELHEIQEDLGKYIQDQRRKNSIQAFIEDLRSHAEIDIQALKG
ncbi:peptidylprolyl isomerase [bacterium]|nr:peptidylprolyl isomerase [bacterium]